MGSSAGGHLTSTLMTHFDLGNPQAQDAVDRLSSRPDLGILCYPVITMEAFGHAGSRRNLLGEFPTAEQVQLLSNEKQVSPGTPPAFVWHTYEDQAVPVRNSLEFASALERHGVPFDLHIYKQGRHGIGLAAKPPEFENPHPWAADLVHWLKAQGFVK
jgi:acetyl esterase/lipase